MLVLIYSFNVDFLLLGLLANSDRSNVIWADVLSLMCLSLEVKVSKDKSALSTEKDKLFKVFFDK